MLYYKGDFVRGDYVLAVKFSGGGGGGLCPSCKFKWGGLCPSFKIHGGDFVHVYKNEQGGGLSGGGDFVCIPFTMYLVSR